VILSLNWVQALGRTLAFRVILDLSR
jgi:hypothetical protein